MSDIWSRLKHQSRAREITGAELALAEALESSFKNGVVDFAEVARRLKASAVVAPISGRTDWDLGLLEAELAAVNRSLDEAYARNGIGA